MVYDTKEPKKLEKALLLGDAISDLPEVCLSEIIIFFNVYVLQSSNSVKCHLYVVFRFHIHTVLGHK